MKKRILLANSLLAAALISASLTGCKKKEDENPKPALGTATISGVIQAELNNNSAGLEKLAGVTILVTVDSREQVLNPNNDTYYNEVEYYDQYTVTYPTKVYSAVTDANGAYSITVEVGDKPVEADLEIQEIAVDVIQTSGPAVREIFGGTGNDFTLVKGSKIVYDRNL